MRQEDHSHTGCTQHSVSLSRQEEGGQRSRVNKIGQGEKKKKRKARSREDGEGRGVVDTAHCHCYSPLQKMATSIKSLMIPTLCHGSAGERRTRNVWARERRGVMQRRGEIMEWVIEWGRNKGRQRKGKERVKRGSTRKVSGEKEWGDDKWKEAVR